MTAIMTAQQQEVVTEIIEGHPYLDIDIVTTNDEVVATVINPLRGLKVKTIRIDHYGVTSHKTHGIDAS